MATGGTVKGDAPPAAQQETASAPRFKMEAVVLLQLAPLLFCFGVLPAFAWGLGYGYLGRTRRFISALLLAPLLLIGVPVLVYLGLRASAPCSRVADAAECQGWTDLGSAVLAVASAFALLALAVIVMTADAVRLARAANRAHDRAAASSPPGPYATEQAGAAEEHAVVAPCGAPASARTALELQCAVEAAGLAPTAADAAFCRTVRADWLAGEMEAAPFADPAMNALYAELLSLRREQEVGGCCPE